MNKRMRIVLIVIGILAIAGGLAGYLAFTLTAALPNTAERFFLSLKEQQFEKAYALTSAQFQSQNPFDAFVESMRRHTFDTFTGAKWTHRTVENDVATLEGSITTKMGGTIPMIVDFVKEEGQWKVFGIHPPEGVSASNEELSETELNALAHATVMRFADAVARKDFSPFYDAISDAWKSQTSPAELKEIFESVIAAGFDFSSLRNVDPIILESPFIDENRALTFTVEYPSPQGKVSFRLKYLEELPQEWRLAGLKVW